MNLASNKSLTNSAQIITKMRQGSRMRITFIPIQGAVKVICQQSKVVKVMYIWAITLYVAWIDRMKQNKRAKSALDRSPEQ